MRLQIRIDSATTKEMRELQQAFHEAVNDDPNPTGFDADTSIKVRVNGPECWSAETPMIPERLAGMVMAIYADRLRAIRQPLID